MHWQCKLVTLPLICDGDQHNVLSGWGLVCEAAFLALSTSCSLRWQLGRESAGPDLCVCVSCHIQLICQRSGLFLERPELAAQNRAIINLQPLEQDAGGGPCESRGSRERVRRPLPEQVTKHWSSQATRYSISTSAETAPNLSGKH